MRRCSDGRKPKTTTFEPPIKLREQLECASKQLGVTLRELIVITLEQHLHETVQRIIEERQAKLVELREIFPGPR